MKAPISYYFIRYFSIWADLIDAIISIVSFNFVFTNLGMKMRCWDTKRRLKKLAS